ncbi:MAG: hypothetical protein KC475_02235 [Cyanobacteria bacterium HKST-UBA03]|nr:hypothetical protein [Cyanobacteria bacterium HKST-UBA03]
MNRIPPFNTARPAFGIAPGNPSPASDPNEPNAVSFDAYIREQLGLPPDAPQHVVDQMLADPVGAANQQMGLPADLGHGPVDTFVNQQLLAAPRQQLGLPGVNASDGLVLGTLAEQPVADANGGTVPFASLSDRLAELVGPLTKGRLAELAQQLKLPEGAGIKQILAALGQFAGQG